MTNVANFALFQIAWFACVLGAARGAPWLGPLVVGATLAIHARYFALRHEWRVWIVVALVGTLADSALTQAGILVFDDESRIFGSAGPPLWIVALWLVFATLLRHSLAWLGARPWLAVLLGGVGGMLSYRAGVGLGALALHPDARLAYGVLGIEWAVLTPAALRVSRALVQPAKS